MTTNSSSSARPLGGPRTSLTHAVRAAAGSQRDLVRLSLLARPGGDARRTG